MRNLHLISRLALLLLVLSYPASGATLQTYARVNLVQGAEAMAVPEAVNLAGAPLANLGQLSETLAQPAVGHQLQFVVAGPAEQQVNLQLTSLGSDAQWEDQTALPGTRMASRHDADGLLWIGLGPEGGAMANLPVPPETGSSTRLVLSVIYE